MKKPQKLLFLIFTFTYFIRTAITCFSLDQLIKNVGADKLGLYIGYSAIIAIAAILFLTFIFTKISSITRFISLHFLFVIAAIICLMFENKVLQAQIVFLIIMGFQMIIYFNNWSLAAIFVTPFESKRLYPWLGSALQIGVLLGALFAMAAHAGLSDTYYYTSWLVGEIIILGTVFYLSLHSKSHPKHKDTLPTKEKPISLKSLYRNYTLLPQLTVWVFLWGLLFYSMTTLTGATFDKSEVNLTALYGALELTIAVLSAFLAAIIYPKVVRWFRLSSILFMSSIIVFVCGVFYIFFNIFSVAIFIFVLFSLIEDSFVSVAISTEFGLYPLTHRDRIRLLAEILAMSVGTAAVGLVFILPSSVTTWLLLVLFVIFVLFGYFSRRGYVKEILQFLKGRDEEEQKNAIALFDLMEEKEGYQKLLELLTHSDNLATRINILNTFASLGTTKPATTILELLKISHIDPLKIAILNYFENVSVKKLDPFFEYEFINILRGICRSRSSNILRSMAAKQLVQYGTLEATIGFINEALKDKDDRVIANAIEGLYHIQYSGVVMLLKPFLDHKIPRVRANTIITLWKYPEIRQEVQETLHNMLHTKNLGQIISGIYAVGEVKNTDHIEFLKKYLTSPKKEIQRGAAIALLKLEYEDYVQNVIDMILGDDEQQAINVCYLSLRVDERILNECIIAGIYERGKKQRELALKRYSQCGGFCREQLELLSGKKITGPLD